jgi:hypothetical protein
MRLMACRHLLSATSVTLHVFTMQMSATSPLPTVSTPAAAICLPIVLVSAKLSLQPRV